MLSYQMETAGWGDGSMGKSACRMKVHEDLSLDSPGPI